MALSDHLDRLRAKPDHVRERIAFGTAAGITGIVATVWAVTLAATGTFSLAPSSDTVTDNSPASDVTQVAAQTQNGFTQLVGAAGAALGATSTSPDLKIVDGGTSSSLQQKQTVANNTNATVIPF